jgi:AcrR family transcriptional regulator
LEIIRLSADKSKREAAKEDRRRRIVDAARSLIRETGDAGLSMRALAVRANVSLATPYNLFGSKRAIVVAVLEDVREFHERFSTLKDVSAVERIFKALSITLGYHVQDPDFYRTIWTSLLDRAGNPDLSAELITPQSEMFWRNLLCEAVQDEAIARDIDIDLLQQDLGRRFASVMLTWILGGFDVTDLEPAMCYSYALSLCAAATDGYRPVMRERMIGFQRQLSRINDPQAAA